MKEFEMKEYEQTALTNTDSYKVGHAPMYPSGTTRVYDNWTARSNYHLNIPARFKDGKWVWIGLQMYLLQFRNLWKKTFFDIPVDQACAEYKDFVAPFCGPNGYDDKYIRNIHKLGYLPLHIKALPEGSLVNIGIPAFTIDKTHDDAFWLPNFIETMTSAEGWKSSTSATMSRAYRLLIEEFAEKTGGSKEFVMWQGHDFSVRGMSGILDAAKSGLGHLASFYGTDNLPAVKAIQDVYNGKATFIGGSVPATEHSVMCAGGKATEIETFRRLIKQFPSGVLSIVSDTWDYWHVITKMAVELKEEILARVPDSLGLAKVVFRPDSGDPVKIVCGLKHKVYDTLISFYSDYWNLWFDDYDVVKVEGTYYNIDFDLDTNSDPVSVALQGIVDESVVKGSVECLWDIFGGTTNEKGFRTLNQRVGLIYGDSITLQRAQDILEQLAEKGFASDNIVFGIGSFTFQYQTRDTLGFAMKATYAEVDGVGSSLFKDPVTDSGTKKSAQGLLRVEKEGDDFVLYQNQTEEQEKLGELKTVFLNGEITSRETIAGIRERLWPKA
jgi:nicotinamide phosphoribosyltransferase